MLRLIAIGIAAGLCVGLAGAPEEAFALAWLGPGLLMLGIERWDGARVPPRAALAMGLACGFATNAWTMRWAVELFEHYAMLPTPAALALAALLWLGQAAPWAIACWLAASIRERTWLVLPLALLVASSLVPMIFPWRPGVSQTGWLPFVQCAELGGPPLVDAFFLFGACAGMQALRARSPRVAVIAIALVGIPCAYGRLRIDAVDAEREAAPLLRVGLVQHGLGIEERMDATRTMRDHLAMRADTAALERDGADLVIWPESAYGFGWPRDWIDDPIGDEGFFRDGVHGPLLVGAISGTWTDRWNSVLALEDGRVTGIADKVHLMTFTEEVPFWDDLPPLQQIVPRGLSRGEVHTDVLAIAHTRVGILNCFEDLVPDHAREVTALGAALLTNHTNDAWFGDTGAPHLHRFLSVMRTIETRRDLVRVVGTGPSGLTDATGRRDEGTPTFVAARRIVPARLLETTTPWVEWGDQVTLPAIALLVALVLRARAARV
jgi:apolipoprotein N-acyltransferase